MSNTQASPHAAALRILTLSAAIGLAIGGFQFAATRSDAAPAGLPVTISDSGSSNSGAPHFADLIERVRPAVVNISTTRELRASARRMGMQGRAFGPDGRQIPMPDDQMGELFKRFFGPQFQGPDDGPVGKAQAAGSGFVVDPDGYIVTNNHVVADADSIVVTMQDGRKFDATLKGRDEKTDLALLKIEPKEALTYVALGNSDNARVGDWVIAIGNPFGLGGTATAGIISARGRDIHSGPFDDYLQVDAPINQGNSGGPIFDERGRVVGVNTAIYSPNGGSVGIGFAIPANTVTQVVEDLKSHGSVERGWLGVQIQPLTDEIAESLALNDTNGALVAQVVPDSPAAKAGIHVGDVILRFGDKDIADVRDLTRAVATTHDGDKTEMRVWRDGRNETLAAHIAKAAADEQTQVADATGGAKGSNGLGMQLAPVTADEDAGGNRDGALVMEVRPGSKAADTGIAEGDIIRQVGSTHVRNPADVIAAVKAAKEARRKTVLMLVERGGARSFVPVELS